jgi:phosphohistidine phosphatase
MRRHLVLVRHAKSAWDDPSLTDHERPLAPRGLKALPRVRDHLAESGLEPQVVLCSTSRRTRDTLDGIRPALPTGAQVEIDDELYLASATELLARLRGVDDAVACAMVIAHDPGLRELAVRLAGAGDAGLRARLSEKFPTAAAATLSFDGPWSGLRPGGARLDDLFTPRRKTRGSTDGPR